MTMTCFGVTIQFGESASNDTKRPWIFKVKSAHRHIWHTSPKFVPWQAAFELGKVHRNAPQNDLNMFKLKNTNMHATYLHLPPPLPKPKNFIRFTLLRWAIFEFQLNFAKLAPNNLKIKFMCLRSHICIYIYICSCDLEHTNLIYAFVDLHKKGKLNVYVWTKWKLCVGSNKSEKNM